jgi:Ca2+-binding RTX toxin-like protein
MRACLLIVGLVAALLVPVPGKAKQTRRCGGYRVTKTGTPGDDVIRGTRKNDVIAGLAGDDRITGRGKGDVICGGKGNDVLHGNNKADSLYGGGGDDSLFAGKQKVRQGRCDDTGGGPAAPAACAFLWDVLAGGPGADVLIGSPSPDSLHGGNGDDRIVGKNREDSIDGDGGDDVVRAGPGNDSITFTSAPRPVRVSLAEGRAAGWGRDVLQSVENVSGSVYSDVLVGDEHDNSLYAIEDGLSEGGDDVLRGRRGEDYMFGFGGADDMYGGRGDDFMNGDDTKDRPGPDRLFGGAGTDRCFYGEHYEACEKRAGE